MFCATHVNTERWLLLFASAAAAAAVELMYRLVLRPTSSMPLKRVEETSLCLSTTMLI
jgi:hypothetical protein